MKRLGIPQTLGEFRKLTEEYPDETLLQFRNEPVHELIEIDGMLCFNETNRWDKIAIIGGGCGFYGIDEVRTILIAHENVVSYPELPKNGEWLHADDPDMYLAGIKQTLTKKQFRGEFLCIRPDVVETFRNRMSQLKSAAIEASSAIERIGEIKYEQSFNENKKRKGHERPYKYHR